MCWLFCLLSTGRLFDRQLVPLQTFWAVCDASITLRLCSPPRSLRSQVFMSPESLLRSPGRSAPPSFNHLSAPWFCFPSSPPLLLLFELLSSPPWPRPLFWSQLCNPANDAEEACCQHILRAAGARLHKLVNKGGPLPRQPLLIIRGKWS